MNLLEAIKSGKPFKRPAHAEYLVATETNGLQWMGLVLEDAVSLSTAALLAEDWELKPEPREYWIVLHPSGSPYVAEECLLDAEHSLEDIGNGIIIHVKEVEE